MKRIAILCLAAFLAASLSAQQLTLGSMKGEEAYGPALIGAFKEAGFDAKIKAFDQQPDLVQALAKGSVDAAFFLAQPIIEQAKGSVMIPVRLAFADICAVTTDPGIKISGPGDLRKYTVGVVKGHVGHAAVTRGMAVVEAANEMEELKMLAAGRFQVAISISDLVPIMSRPAGLTKYYIQTPPLLRTPTFLALSASRASLKDKILEILKKRVESGQWERETAKPAK